MSTANDIAMTDIEKGLSTKLTEDNDNIPEEKSLIEKDMCTFCCYSKVSNNHTYVRQNQKESFHSHVEDSNWY